MNAGTFDVNTLQLGTLGSGTAAGNGTFNLSGGTLKVNTILELGHTGGTVSVAGSNTVGQLNITGGTVGANTIAIGVDSGTNSVSVTTGALIVSNTIGSASTLLSAFALANSTLTLTPAVTTVAYVGTLTTGGTTNIINVPSLPSSNAPASFTLISYTNQAGTFNIGLGSIPAGPYGSAYITNDTSASAVILVLVPPPTPPTPPQIGSIKLSAGNVIITGSNGVASGNYYLLTSTNVALPLNQWPSVLTNQFDINGNFNLTNPMTPGVSRQFYLLQDAH